MTYMYTCTCSTYKYMHQSNSIGKNIFRVSCYLVEIRKKKLIMLIIKFKKSILHVTHLSTGQPQNLYRCHKTNGKKRTCACHKRPFSGFFRQDV